MEFVGTDPASAHRAASLARYGEKAGVLTEKYMPLVAAGLAVVIALVIRKRMKKR